MKKKLSILVLISAVLFSGCENNYCKSSSFTEENENRAEELNEICESSKELEEILTKR